MFIPVHRQAAGRSTTHFYEYPFFNVMASLAEMERDLMRERTNAGLEAARLAGRRGGRPSAMTKSKKKAASVLLDAGKPAKEVAETLGIKISTFYRHFPAGRE